MKPASRCRVRSCPRLARFEQAQAEEGRQAEQCATDKPDTPPRYAGARSHAATRPPRSSTAAARSAMPCTANSPRRQPADVHRPGKPLVEQSLGHHGEHIQGWRQPPVGSVHGGIVRVERGARPTTEYLPSASINSTCCQGCAATLNWLKPIWRMPSSYTNDTSQPSMSCATEAKSRCCGPFGNASAQSATSGLMVAAARSSSRHAIRRWLVSSRIRLKARCGISVNCSPARRASLGVSVALPCRGHTGHAVSADRPASIPPEPT